MLNLGIDPSTKRNLVIDDNNIWVGTLPLKVSDESVTRPELPISNPQPSESMLPSESMQPSGVAVRKGKEQREQHECKSERLKAEREVREQKGEDTALERERRERLELRIERERIFEERDRFEGYGNRGYYPP